MMTNDCTVAHPSTAANSSMQPTMANGVVNSNDASEQFVSLLKKPNRPTKHDNDGHHQTRRQNLSSAEVVKKYRSSTLTNKLESRHKTHIMASATTTAEAPPMTEGPDADPSATHENDDQNNSKSEPGATNQDQTVGNLKFKQRAINKNQLKEAKQQRKSQKPRRRVATMAQRRAANIRERRRMFNLNSAFDKLRKKVPSFAYEKRLSRIETLKLAIMYIKFMDNLVKDEDYIEKYKQLTANSGVGGLASSSSLLSSGTFLSLYGQHHRSSEQLDLVVGEDHNHDNQAFNETNNGAIELKFDHKSSARSLGGRKQMAASRHAIQLPLRPIDCVQSASSYVGACGKALYSETGAQQYRIKQSSSSPSNVTSCCPSASPPNSTTSATTASCRSSSVNFGPTSNDCCSPLSTSPMSSSGAHRQQSAANYSGNVYYMSKSQHPAQEYGQQHYNNRDVMDVQVQMGSASYFDVVDPLPKQPMATDEAVTYYNLQPKFSSKQSDELNKYHQPQNQPASSSFLKDQSILHNYSLPTRAPNCSPSQLYRANAIDHINGQGFASAEINQTNNHYEPYNQHQQSHHHHLSSLASAHHPPVVGYPINSQLQAR